MTPSPASPVAPAAALPPGWDAGVATRNAPAIECRGLRVTYRERRLWGRSRQTTAVDGVDLSVERGACMGLLGPNGAGKTSLIEVLEGLRPATAGEVRLLGHSWRDGRAHLQARIGVASQETHFWDCLAVREVLQLVRSFYPRPASADALLEMVGLLSQAGTWVGRLSGGQRQRLALASALVGQPELLFLDEPTTGLDPSARRDVWEVVRQCRARGTTIVLTTHFLEEAELLCDRVAIMEKGRVLQEGAPGALVLDLGLESRIDLELAGASADGDEAAAAELAASGSFGAPASIEALLARVPGVSRVDWARPTWTLASSEPAATLAVLMRRLPEHGLACHRLSVRRPSLEEAFFSVTSRASRPTE